MNINNVSPTKLALLEIAAIIACFIIIGIDLANKYVERNKSNFVKDREACENFCILQNMSYDGHAYVIPAGGVGGLSCICQRLNCFMGYCTNEEKKFYLGVRQS